MYGLKFTSVSKDKVPESMRWVKERTGAKCGMDCPIMECHNCELVDECLTKLDKDIIRILGG